jgi:alkanesulfonate monooxygenase
MTALRPRFGVWAVVRGTFGSAHHPEDPVDASWVRNQRQIIEAEALGYDATLLAQHTISPIAASHSQLEAWTASAALAALTSRIEIITAIKPFLFHPVVLAKMALQIEEISQGRFAINFVNAWYKPELEKAGIGFPEHDERYEYGREWVTVFRDLVSGRRTTFAGSHFDVKDYELRPAGVFRERLPIYIGGESEPARSLAADVADTWFINGQPLDRVTSLIRDVASRPRKGAPLRFALAAFVIARDTDEEADAELASAWELAQRDQSARDAIARDTDTSAVMFQTFRELPQIGTNGGTAAELVGSYDTVARRISDFALAGIELFMLQFQPLEAETRRFAHEVIPRVRRLEALAAN